jgi:UDP-N-acetylmuramoyl-tripeptide--D-alanyl-D-alanine ligase
MSPVDTAGTPMMTLGEAHAMLPGSALTGDAALRIERVHSDTRTLRAGDLFVALKGERFDAHDYLAQAKSAGAVAALAERGLAEAGLPGLQVDDSRRALGDLAAAWRRRFELPLVAVAGSNGKTTVTQMTAAILRAWLADAAFATEGNFNNDIGVPLTLLRLGPGHRAAVIELGMNHVGEIARLAQIAAPTVALVNNAQREHQEFMHSVEAVARENGAAIEALGAQGIAVFPADDAHASVWQQQAGERRVITFALQARADVEAEVGVEDGAWLLTVYTPIGSTVVKLALAGLHNVKNALAATAAAVAAGCPLKAIARGLSAFEPVKGRSQVKRFVAAGREATLIDDTYNANPDSVRAAIDVLASMPGPRWLVLGDMGEVGERGPEFHAEVGQYAASKGIDALWTAGTLSTHASAVFHAARHFDDVATLLAALPQMPAAASVVVKGSRFMKMEQVVAALVSTGGAHAA